MYILKTKIGNDTLTVERLSHHICDGETSCASIAWISVQVLVKDSTSLSIAGLLIVKYNRRHMKTFWVLEEIWNQDEEEGRTADYMASLPALCIEEDGAPVIGPGDNKREALGRLVRNLKVSESFCTGARGRSSNLIMTAKMRLKAEHSSMSLSQASQKWPLERTDIWCALACSGLSDQAGRCLISGHSYRCKFFN